MTLTGYQICRITKFTWNTIFSCRFVITQKKKIPDGEGMCVCVERMDFNRHSNTCDLKVPGEVTVPFEVRFFLFF